MKSNDIVRMFRMSLDYSVSEVSKKTGITEADVHDIEVGKKKVPAILIYFYADVYKVKRNIMVLLLKDMRSDDKCSHRVQAFFQSILLNYLKLGMWLCKFGKEGTT